MQQNKTFSFEVQELLIEAAKNITLENLEVILAKANVLRTVADIAFKESIHKRPHVNPAPVIFFDGNVEAIEVKNHHAGGFKPEVYDWVAIGIDKIFERGLKNAPFVVTLKETYPNAPLKDLAAGILTASERYYGRKGAVTTHQLEDKSGILVTIL